MESAGSRRTITGGGGASLHFTNSGGTLNGVTLNADLTPTGSSTPFVTVSGGLTLNGVAYLGLGTTALSPPLGDMAQYIESLRKLLNYDIKVICPGHGPLVREPRRKIEELIAHRIDRENQVLGLLGGGKHTIAAMVGDIYPELDSRLLGAAQGQVRAHLVKLQREGKITVEEKEGEEGRYFLK